jgi:large subunit ribosomal protein L15
MLDTLHTTTKRKKKKLIGRGGKHAKTAGRGTKGQKARAGHRMRPQMRDIIKKLPKLRGRGKNSNKAFRVDAVVVNLRDLSVFAKGDTVTPATLKAKGLVKEVGGVLPMVKILGTGTIESALTVYDCLVSVSAKEAIEKAGGTVKTPTI